MCFCGIFHRSDHRYYILIYNAMHASGAPF